MNYRGSQRALRDNACSAMLAAIELYNEPNFRYREECVCILIVNAWELILKACLSKHGQSIYRPKVKGKDYRTLGLNAALDTCKPYFPASIPYDAVCRNLGLSSYYRDNAVHFYNSQGLADVLYALFQTSIVNFRDFVLAIFGRDIKDQMNLALLPLSFGPPLDPIQFLSGDSKGVKYTSASLKFLAAIRQAAQELEDSGVDTSRLLTVHRVKLESVKKVTSADFIAGVTTDPTQSGSNVIMLTRRFDPNDPNWMRMKEMLPLIGEIQGIAVTSHVFQAIVWRYGIKGQERYCWASSEGTLTKYSRDLIGFFRGLSTQDVKDCLQTYRERPKKVIRKLVRH